MQTWHIHIQGVVQGVGFRPSVFKLATMQGIGGWVTNDLDGVHIRFNGVPEVAQAFYRKVISDAPATAAIRKHRMYLVQAEYFDQFAIRQSQDSGSPLVLPTPDVALCERCKSEVEDPNDRRFDYPFITCTSCGPRYSISTGLPFDRENTTMNHLEPCEACKVEYMNVEDPRMHAQTITCPACGIRMKLYGNDKIEFDLSQDEIIGEIITAWRKGKIVAIKGIGGYLLTCDATSATTIRHLRARKHRPAKPLAVMFPDMHLLSQQAWVSQRERAALSGDIAPIVLLKYRRECTLPMKEIAPGLTRVGAMLPYAPVFHLLLSRFGKAIIATSANISGDPIEYQDESAVQRLSNLADVIVTNDRPISIPQDDSVVYFTARHQKKIVLRRSRGMAPNVDIPYPGSIPNTVAFGADLKSAFAIFAGSGLYLSQFLGKLDSFQTQRNFSVVCNHFLSTYRIEPELLLADFHRNYYSTEMARQKAAQTTLEVKHVQHHIAHFCAILLEHKLITANQPVLGVVWDGVGAGLDNCLWGSEFFIWRSGIMHRLGHMSYFRNIAGDKMAIEPRLTALSILSDYSPASDHLRQHFTDHEWEVSTKLIHSDEGVDTCSMGRIFDAVSSVLGLCQKQTYEGEAAAYVQQLAEEYVADNSRGLQPYSCFNDEVPSSKELLIQVFNEFADTDDKARIAARFHVTLVEIIAACTVRNQIKDIACTGGVFQNALLVDMIIDRLPGYRLYFHEQVSPNDENIALGQLAFEYMKPIYKPFKKKSEVCV